MTSTLSSLIDLCERIQAGREVDLAAVEALQAAVMRGDIVTQVSDPRAQPRWAGKAV